MPIVPILIPQIGEGLQEARLVGVLKQPGERIKRDEPIYQMETDKAVMDVESPVDGILKKWLAAVDSILPIGAPVAEIDVAEGDAPGDTAPVAAEPIQSASIHGESGQTQSETEAPNRGLNIPPRTRAYAKVKGLTEAQLAGLAAGGAKVMPADIDAFLAGTPAAANAVYAESPVPPKQRLLASRLVRGSALVVPGTISVPLHWGPIEAERQRLKLSESDFKPSTFTMFAYAVAQTLKDFPAFRSSLIGDDVLRTYHHVALGIAVGLPGDELVLAVVDDADTLSWRGFAERCRERIELARTGKDQANESVIVTLTNMQSFGLRDAVPVVVPPAAATIFLGEPYTGLDSRSQEIKPIRLSNLSMTFDHRFINGVGAAQFVSAIKYKVDHIEQLVGENV